jgi:5'-deoxynucleotidase YfbR-like HD superfamily hydrolase
LTEKPDIEGLLEFLANVGKLKEIPRTGWVESGVEEPESVSQRK